MTFDELLKILVEEKGSNLHLLAGLRPSIRVHGKLVPLADKERLTPDSAKVMIANGAIRNNIRSGKVEAIAPDDPAVRGGRHADDEPASHPALPGGEARLRDGGPLPVREDVARDHSGIAEMTGRMAALRGLAASGPLTRDHSPVRPAAGVRKGRIGVAPGHQDGVIDGRSEAEAPPVNSR